MAEYRKFWLVNALGNKYYLTDESKNKTFLSRPNGFGFRANYRTRKINNSEFLVSEGLDMVDISGELVFYGGLPNVTYADYQEFINFIKFKPLKFYYLTPNFVDDERYSFYADVLISTISKGEVSKDGTLSVQITFHRLSEWLDSTEHVYKLSHASSDGDYSSVAVYDPEEGIYSIGDLTRYDDEIYECIEDISTPEVWDHAKWVLLDTGKHYPLVRPYYYIGSGFSGSTIINTGTDEVGFTMTIDGTIENPIFSLFQNNVRYGLCALDGTFTHVIVNSVDGQSYIYLENNGSTISNPEQRQNFSVRDGISYFTWCKLKVGESTFTLTAGNIDTFTGTAEISFKNSYFSV